MRGRKLKAAFVLLFALSLAGHHIRANSAVIETADVIDGTLEAVEACLEWKMTGICIWMTCVAPMVCTFDTSIQVENFVPEATVQVFTKGDEEPWLETRELKLATETDNEAEWLLEIASIISQTDLSDVGLHGGEETQNDTGRHSGTLSHSVDVYGNPANPIFGTMAEAIQDLICVNEVIPMFPYFISNVDLVTWRWSVPEYMYWQSWFGFIQYDLGSITNNYGPIYPRTSGIAQNDPFKSSVLAAFRSMHVLTRTGQPHVYVPIPTQGGKGWWPPGPLSKGGGDTGMWQMLYPQMDDECQSFPYGRTVSESRRSEKNEYVWNFWRKHKCCEVKGTTLVEVIGVDEE